MSDACTGLLAQFSRPDQLVAAARRMHDLGYRLLDAHTPYPVPDLDDALDLPRSPLPWWTFAGALTGGSLGYFMLWYSSVIDYPLNIGGRPFHSWPSFVPVTFELTVLSAALTVTLGVAVACRLTRLHQPVFDAPGFSLARSDAFFLHVEARDPLFHQRETALELTRLGPEAIHESHG